MNRRHAFAAFLLVLTLASVFAVGRATAAQPHMEAALSDLRQARESLDKASPDKGGHRGRAIDLVKRAISEVEAGMEYDNRHR